MEAARHWARHARHGRQPQEEQAHEQERQQTGIARDDWDDAFAWADDDEAGGEAPQRAPFAVFRCNWPALDFFTTGCRTQWRLSATGRVQGLDYPGVQVVLRMRRVADKPALFAQLQLMELAALEVLNG